MKLYRAVLVVTLTVKSYTKNYEWFIFLNLLVSILFTSDQTVVGLSEAFCMFDFRNICKIDDLYN